jgi:membrane-associated protease RseP (regulator of RpoE activity)
VREDKRELSGPRSASAATTAGAAPSVGDGAAVAPGPTGPPTGGDGPLREASPWTSFGKLLLVVAAGVGLAVALNAVAILVVVLALAAMIMLHELGHFATAKWSGMKVTEYFLGFGPKLWSVRKGETTYGVKALPAGGYVKIVGMTMLEEVDPSDEARSYRQSTFPRRVLVASAGSAVHMILAIALLWSLFVFVGESVPTPPTVAGLLHFSKGETPAQLAGVRAGDIFVSIDGHRVKSIEALSKSISANAGRTLQAVVRRNGHLVRLTLTPVDGRHVTEIYEGGRERYAGTRPTGIIGVLLTTARTEGVGPVAAVPKAGSEFGTLVADTGKGLAEIFSLHGLGSFFHQVTTAGRHSSSAQSSAQSSASSSTAGSGSGSSSGQVISFLGAIQIGAQAYKQDIGELLILLAAINLFVGIVNMFPMLPLDGGHVAVAVYERIRSRRGRRYHADITKLMPVAYVFLAFIVVIGLGALYSNIVQPVHLPGG